MAVRHAITTLLRADAPLMALLPEGPNSVFYQTMEQTADFPAVIFFKTSGVPYYTFGDFHDNELWTVKGVCREGTPTDAEDIDERVYEVLQDANLPLANQLTMWFRRESDLMFAEIEEGAVIHHVGAMYRLLRVHD